MPENITRCLGCTKVGKNESCATLATFLESGDFSNPNFRRLEFYCPETGDNDPQRPLREKCVVTTEEAVYGMFGKQAEVIFNS